MAWLSRLLPTELPIGRSVGYLADIGSAALGVLLPQHCASCDQLVASQGLFCGECFGRAGFVTEPCCTGCGVMFAFAAQGGPERRCPRCRATPPAFSRAMAAFRYDAHAQRLILPFKYSDRTEFCNVLAKHMMRAGASLLREADFLVPVPLHRRRLFQRRYNQAALLAQAVARLSGVAVLPDGLVRRRATPPLGNMTATERHAMLDGVFSVRPCRISQISGRRIVLIDDVMTSGATTNMCTAALKAAGATDVTVLVAARVADPRLS